MNGPPRTAVCDAWCCRPEGGKPRRARRTNDNAGSFCTVSAGAPAVKDASVYNPKRRHGLRRCRYHGPDGMHRWVGLGVIADNLINMATYLDRRSAA